LYLTYYLMVETRVAPRYRVAKPAKIEFGREKIACTILDLSVTGAALLLSDSLPIPATFTLVIPEDGLRLTCNIAWRREFRMGVAFE
jgi:hypothetical protein